MTVDLIADRIHSDPLALPSALPEWVRRVRQVTSLPVGVGFGISQPEQAAWIAGFADAVIIGSAIARQVEDGGADAAPARVAGFLGTVRQAMRAAAPARAG